MTPVEYIALGILAVFALVVVLVALMANQNVAISRSEMDKRRAERQIALNELSDQLRAESAHLSAKARREATERAWSRRREAYAPRRELVRQRARKKP